MEKVKPTKVSAGIRERLDELMKDGEAMRSRFSACAAKKLQMDAGHLQEFRIYDAQCKENMKISRGFMPKPA